VRHLLRLNVCYAVTDVPIVLESDKCPDDGDDDLNNTLAPSTLDGERQGHVALDFDMLPSPFNRSADKVEDVDNDKGENGINRNVSPRGPKR
jgi:hypothetical protein